MTGEKVSTIETAIDPICGMTVDPANAAGSYFHDGTTYYFCSKGCLQQFIAKSSGEPVTEMQMPIHIGREKPAAHGHDHRHAHQMTAASGGTYIDPDYVPKPERFLDKLSPFGAKKPAAD